MLTKQKSLKALLGTAAFALLFGSSSVYAAGYTGGTSGTSGATTSGASSGSQTSGASASGAKSSVGKMSQADEKLMKELAATNMAEMKAAQIALDKSKDDQVQKFAQKMLEDHSNAHGKVRDLAQVKNVSLPNELDGKHQAEMKKLSNLSGDKFDKMYLQQGGVSDHKQAMQLLERIEKNAKDPQLKAMATDLKPTIREHHELATNMVKGNAATTTSGSSGGATGSSSGSSSSGSPSLGGGEKPGSAGLTGRPPANNVELGNQAGSGSSRSSSGSSSGSTGSSKDANGKVIGPTKSNDVGVMDSKNSQSIRKGTESSSGSSATTGK
jgi:putative membrane protein